MKRNNFPTGDNKVQILLLHEPFFSFMQGTIGEKGSEGTPGNDGARVSKTIF